MSCNLVQTIVGSECIGDSRNKINSNFTSLETAVCNLSAGTLNLLNTQNSSTIDLFFNSNTRTLSANVNSAFCFRNKFINGNFDIWQRGDTTTSIDTATASFFSADRWGFYAGVGTNQTFTGSRVRLFGSSSTFFPSRPKNHMRFILGTQAAGDQSDSNTFYQRIENIHTLAGKTMTLSFWAKSNNTGSSLLNCYCNQFYRVSAPQTLSPTVQSIGPFTLTSNWQKFEATFTVPAINQTVYTNAWGSNDDNSLFDSLTQIVFNIPGSAGRTVDFTSAQLEEGSVATPFEQRPIGTELALCQRYYEKSYDLNVVPGTPGTGCSNQFISTIYTFSNNQIGFYHSVPFKVRKRIQPLLDIYSPSSIAGTKKNRVWILQGSPIVSQFDVVPSNVAADENGVVIFAGNYFLQQPYIGIYHYVADAEF
jgi:hypothetical protein